MSESVMRVTDQSFEADVVKSDRLVVLDFWAPWCRPCLMMEPVLEEIAADYPAITVAKLNVDENSDTAIKFDVLSIPTLLVFKDGAVVKRFQGALPKKRLVDELAAWLG